MAPKVEKLKRLGERHVGCVVLEKTNTLRIHPAAPPDRAGSGWQRRSSDSPPWHSRVGQEADLVSPASSSVQRLDLDVTVVAVQRGADFLSELCELHGFFVVEADQLVGDVQVFWRMEHLPGVEDDGVTTFARDFGDQPSYIFAGRILRVGQPLLSEVLLELGAQLLSFEDALLEAREIFSQLLLERSAVLLLLELLVAPFEGCLTVLELILLPRKSAWSLLRAAFPSLQPVNASCSRTMPILESLCCARPALRSRNKANQ